MVASNLTDGEAYKIEQEIIGNYHKQYAGQLWHTIDERALQCELYEIQRTRIMVQELA